MLKSSYYYPILFFMTMSLFSNGQSVNSYIKKAVSNKYFDKEKIDFKSKYLDDFNYSTLDKMIVRLKEDGMRLRKSHPFTIAVTLNDDKMEALLDLKNHDKYSAEFFNNLKKLFNTRGYEKYVRGFRNKNDQQSQFRRIEIINDMEKKSSVSELFLLSENLENQGIIYFEAKKLPEYDFGKEHFVFNFRIDNRICNYKYKIATQEAAALASDWPVYFEASFSVNPNYYEVYLGDFPPSSPRFNVDQDSCN